MKVRVLFLLLLMSRDNTIKFKRTRYLILFENKFGKGTAYVELNIIIEKKNWFKFESRINKQILIRNGKFLLKMYVLLLYLVIHRKWSRIFLSESKSRIMLYILILNRKINQLFYAVKRWLESRKAIWNVLNTIVILRDIIHWHVKNYLGKNKRQYRPF